MDNFGMNLFPVDIEAMHELGDLCCREFGTESSCIEVGSWVGQTALIWASYFGRVYCVDSWELSLRDPHVLDDWWRNCANPTNIDQKMIMQSYRVFSENCRDHIYRSIIPCRGSSDFFVRLWPFPVDFIFIDASHVYEHVKADILGWRRHVKPGGIIAMHDYGIFEGVNRAVDEIFGVGGFSRKGYVAWAIA